MDIALIEQVKTASMVCRLWRQLLPYLLVRSYITTLLLSLSLTFDCAGTEQLHGWAKGQLAAPMQ